MAGGLFCSSGGCTAKLGPDILERVLSRIERGAPDKNLLVGFDSSDDAAVYRVSDDVAVVQTLDFFPPMLEDPYVFGQIAATNAVSDVYAMGGEVISALNIVCFPQDEDLNVLGEIMRGGSEKVVEAGAVLCGGHSINDRDVKYGLSVNGVVHPDRIYKNNGGQAGDVLILTKKLGVGIMNTANRVGAASKEAMAEAIASMTTLNKYAAAISKRYTVHACTDVTGFGLLGHTDEMAAGSGVTIRIYSQRLSLLPGALELAEMGIIPAGAYRNLDYVKPRLTVAESVQQARVDLICDPQTSGGLLIALPVEDAGALAAALREHCPDSAIVGTVLPQTDHTLEIV